MLKINGECVAIMIMPHICEVLDSVVKLSFALMCSNTIVRWVIKFQVQNFHQFRGIYSIFKIHAQFSKALHSDSFQNTKKMFMVNLFFYKIELILYPQSRNFRTHLTLQIQWSTSPALLSEDMFFFLTSFTLS